MLPTKGYFHDIECPYFDTACNRPYCHFRHRKKCSESSEDPEPVPEVAPTHIPTYKPTPKSELANNKSHHIPISYVPDLTFRSSTTTTRQVRPVPKIEKPTYKPTPLSILSSANKREDLLHEIDKSNEDLKTINEIKQNTTDVKYYPEISFQHNNDEINFEELSEEFDLIDDIIKDVDKQEAEEKELTNTVEKYNEKSIKEEKNKTYCGNSEKSENNSKHKSKEKNINKHSRHSKSKDSRKDKEKEREKEKSKSHHSKKHKKESHRDKERSSHKERHKDVNKDKKKHESCRKDENRDKNQSKIKEKKEEETKQDNKIYEISDDDDGNDNINDMRFEDFDDGNENDEEEEEDTLMECYKIFSEYKPPTPEKLLNNDQPSMYRTNEQTNEEILEVVGKKRIAHGGNETTLNKINKLKPISQASHIMNNRYKIAMATVANNEQKHIINEVKQNLPMKRTTAPSLLDAAREYKLFKPTPANSVFNGAIKSKSIKIAPVRNVNSMQIAKAKIISITKQNSNVAMNKTPAQTIKGTKRIAHIPTDNSMANIPDVLNADKSKLPINVRTRFLTMLAEECCKLYINRQDAHTRALNEEFSCYEKCKVLATYKNSSMLAVNRLRKELQEREKLGLGPYDTGESIQNDKKNEYKGKQFYEYVKNYLLTDDELDLHGYPRESLLPGRAIIKNKCGQNTIVNKLRDNQRKCARCSKIYIVDKDGMVVHSQECIYHPLKKRTLRGEQIYLCCKSSDETGCATSNTHVCDMSDDELDGFQMTMDPECDDDPRNYAVYALDCEMCYTVKGLELTRITIVDIECKTVYESFVKPLNRIVDYNTNFSGITKEQMDKTSTSILQVQANILHLCNSKTILIGHSLESDMKALKIIHNSIIDTSVLFPHKMGLPHKRALRVLASEYLKKIIQNNICGHDSAEDAITCMELVKWKLKEEVKLHGIK